MMLWVIGIKELKGYHTSHFKTKDLGYLTSFLGLGFFVQTKALASIKGNMQKIYSLVNLTDAKVTNTRLELNAKFVEIKTVHCLILHYCHLDGNFLLLRSLV